MEKERIKYKFACLNRVGNKMSLDHQDIKKLLINLAKIHSTSDNIIDMKDTTNIVKSAGLDSFGLLNFIMDVESELDVSLTVNELSNDANQTVSGLTFLIVNKNNMQTD